MSDPNSLPASVIPPGVTSDFLIDPDYVRALGWGLNCIRDRLTLRQIAVLSGSDCPLSGHVYGSFVASGSHQAILLERDPKAISMYFAEMVGGDICVFDLPNSLLICVLEGDITIMAGAKEKVSMCVGSSEMRRAEWTELLTGLRSDIGARLRAKYLA